MTARPASVTASETAAGSFLRTLKRQGVEWLFGNAGTDFAAIIEAYAGADDPSAFPAPVTVPHENLAVAMAHGAYLMTACPQAVMVHVNVGTANAICGLINAARERVPLILCAGRNPITETGSRASRNAFIHWGQEMFDQGAMLRELVKWDYELRRAEQAADMVDRAVTIATAHPRGPVYLTLPRETLGGELPLKAVEQQRPARVREPEPNAAGIAEAAGWLAQAERVVLVAGGYGIDERERAALQSFAGKHAVAVAAMRPRLLPIPTDHSSFVGFEPGPLVEAADLIIVASTDVPWIPLHTSPKQGARVVHIGHDPAFSRYPVRGFRSDLALDGSAASALIGISAASEAQADVLARRQEWLGGRRRAFEAQRKRPVPATGEPTYDWVARCLSEALRDGDAIFCETAFPAELLDLPEGVGFFGAPSSGGLGWALGAALGAKLAAPARRVITLVGDGAYMFGNPTPAHFVARAERLPTLTIILNNRMWAAVRRATLAVYPQSATRSGGAEVFTHLEPSPAFEKIIEASGGYGECVDRAEDLPEALERAFAVVEHEKRQALINVLAGN